MLLIGKVIVFLLGMCLAVQVVAAFYRILDLWYTIQTEYPVVIKGLFLWFGISGLCAVLLGENLRNAFLWGMALYIPFYVVNFFSLQFIIRYRYKKGERAIHKEQQGDTL